MTLDEMAKQLGVSKSTVSRALSGKGRIGQQTREKITVFAMEHGISEEKKDKAPAGTKNIGVIFPEDVYVNVNPYFQECLLGICESAAVMDYQVLLTMGKPNDISEIQRLVENKKVDAVILTRSLEDDRAVRYLTGMNFPVGMTGQCDSDAVIQVDTDNEGAAESLTSLLISRGFRKFAGVVEDLSYHVNRNRYDGISKALMKNGIPKENQVFYTGNLRMEMLDSIIEDLIARKVECIICGDDIVCTRLMSRLQAEGYRIPRDVAIASLYNSATLECFTPAITAVSISGRQMGNLIGKQMINYLQGREYQKKTIMDYEILFRKSTSR